MSALLVFARGAEFREVPPLAAPLAAPINAALTPGVLTPSLGPVLPSRPLPEVKEAQAPGALGQASLIEPKQDGPGAAQPSAEAESCDFTRAFDGLLSSPAGTPVFAEPQAGWSLKSFASADGEARISYKQKDGDPARPARVYSGGLALNESFESYFKAQGPRQGSQYFLWTRGHPPSAWTATKSPLDADARDLARLINEAASGTSTGKVELALHSYGNLVFQRMVQLRGEPEVSRALSRLAGAKVFMLNATTHYEGSERRAGPEFEQMGTVARQFIDWLDLGDLTLEDWRAAARLNPLLIPQVSVMAAQWEAQRRLAIGMASSQAAQMMKKDLDEPWPQPYESIRRDFQKALSKDSRDPGWQEALLRRSAGMFRLEFSKDDVKYLRRLGARLELVHSASDKLLNWASAQALFERLGITPPAQAPQPGAVLTDRTGRFRATIVDGDHYFPLKKPAELAEVLDR